MAQYPTLIKAIRTILEWLIVSVTPVTSPQLAEVIAISPDDESLDFDAVYTEPDDIIEPVRQLVALDQQMEQQSSNCVTSLWRSTFARQKLLLARSKTFPLIFPKQITRLLGFASSICPSRISTFHILEQRV